MSTNDEPLTMSMFANRRDFERAKAEQDASKVKMPAIPPLDLDATMDAQMTGYGIACAEAMREACALECEVHAEGNPHHKAGALACAARVRALEIEQ